MKYTIILYKTSILISYLLRTYEYICKCNIKYRNSINKLDLYIFAFAEYLENVV